MSGEFKEITRFAVKQEKLMKKEKSEIIERLETLEYKHAIVCEALEWVRDCSVDYQAINKARQALNGVEHE